ncbi:carbohydrate esterase family 10 protein [Ceratobasidium sp. AG-Ba]|nr:carbohydrate esterase family 10 protein [Ceratobasidium sp. AG-Ba]
MPHSRDHPFSKGSESVEEKPRDPPPSHSAAFALGVVGLAALSYLTHGYVNSAVTSLLGQPSNSNNLIPKPETSPSFSPVVDLGYASYRGLLNDTVPNTISWLGVPYARPPRRFRAPQPLDETAKEHEVEDKQKYPEPCVQSWSPGMGFDDRGGAGTEDCLVVNIYAPKTYTNASSYPVLTYIHGGGFYNGNPHTWPFDNWVQRSPTPFVAVSIYYRLSALGFLASPDSPGKGVHAGPDPELLLNAGIHDQRLALKWIQKHIHAFGGDPGRVTIMGQSAGGGSVGLHLVAKTPEPEHLFNRAILQSWYRTPVPYPADRKASWNHLTKLVGCSHWTWSTQRTLECLRQVDTVKLIQAADEGMAKHLKDAYWMWQPVVDGTLFPDYPARLLNEKKDVDIMVGHTTHDTVTAGPTYQSFVPTIRAAYPKLSMSDAHTLEKLYTHAGVAPDSVSDFGIGEGMFRCGMHALAKVYEGKIYSYRFDEPDPVNPDRADHCADNWILFEGTRPSSNGTNVFNPLTPAQRALSDETISYMVSFAATGDPNSLRSSLSSKPEFVSPIWPVHSSGKRLVFRAESGGTGVTKGVKGGSYLEDIDEDEVKRCEVWEKLAGGTQF